MRVYDISMKISSGMPVYKNLPDKAPVFKITRDFASDGVFESSVTLNMHTGTHMDSPLHVLKDGSQVGDADLGRLITRCRVIDLTGLADRITKDDLEQHEIRPGDFILLKTRNSLCDCFDEGFIYLSKEGAQYLKDMGVAGVGIDSLGIEREQSGHPTHKILLGSGVIVLEGLRLAGVAEGEYTLIALPLNIEGAEASPVRAVLLEGRIQS